MQIKNIDMVTGVCLAENYASARVLEKCGFKRVFEGTGSYQNQYRNIIKYVYSINNPK